VGVRKSLHSRMNSSTATTMSAGYRRGRSQLRRFPLWPVVVGDYSQWASQLMTQLVIAFANRSTAVALASIQWLMAGLGQSSEPDPSVIVPVYDRVLAISLLLLGAVVALALIERIFPGSLGTGVGLIPRVVAATFAAFAGLSIVKYVAGYAALLATAWTPDFASLNTSLIHSVAVSDAVAQGHIGAGPHVSTSRLIFTRSAGQGWNELREPPASTRDQSPNSNPVVTRRDYVGFQSFRPDYGHRVAPWQSSRPRWPE
jgi:hypothetical protein